MTPEQRAAYLRELRYGRFGAIRLRSGPMLNTIRVQGRPARGTSAAPHLIAGGPCYLRQWLQPARPPLGPPRLVKKGTPR